LKNLKPILKPTILDQSFPNKLTMTTPLSLWTLNIWDLKT